MSTAKVFKSGNSQAIRLPKEFQTKEKEFYIKKDGDLIMLIPKDKVWEIFEQSFGEFTDDFFAEGRQQPAWQEREGLD